MSTVVRVVRHGRVKVGGKWYAASQRHQAYKGELDGLRYAFGTYPPDVHAVSLWGPAVALTDISLIDQGPHVQAGALPWDWWNELDTPPTHPASDRTGNT